MKNLFITFATISIIFSSCSKAAKDQIIGSWLLSKQTVNGVINTASNGAKLTFNACSGGSCDGTFTLNGAADNFTYSVSADEKSILLTSGSTGNTSLTINTLTSTELTVTNTSGSQVTVSTFSKL